MKQLLGDIYLQQVKSKDSDLFINKIYFLIDGDYRYCFNVNSWCYDLGNKRLTLTIGDLDNNYQTITYSKFISLLRESYKYSEEINPNKRELILTILTKIKRNRDTPKEIIKNFREHRKKYKRLLKKFKIFKKEHEKKVAKYREYQENSNHSVKSFVERKLQALDELRVKKAIKNEDLTFVDGVIEGLVKIKKYINITTGEKENENPMYITKNRRSDWGLF